MKARAYDVRQVAVEIISDTDAGDAAWNGKLESYRHLGCGELVRFDPEDAERPLRVWDRVHGTLLERELPAQEETLWRPTPRFAW